MFGRCFGLLSAQLQAEVLTQLDGSYSGAIQDFLGETLAGGDQIKATVFSKDGTTELGSKTELAPAEANDIISMTIDVDLPANPPSALVSVATPGPLTWTYTLTPVNGAITGWSYTGAGIADARVTGTAASTGWTVDTKTDTKVIFTTTTPLTSTVSGFEIDGNQGGTGTYIAGFKEDTVDGSLPVELVSFTGAVINGGVRIEWRTATEVNNLGFNLYRSKTREGKFEKVNPGLIEGAGSSPLPHNYQFVDRDVEPGEVYYYYLVDIDITGITEKSDLLEVNLKTNRSSFQARLLVPAATRLLQNFPNPFNPETWLPFYLASDTNVKIRIHNLLGETVRTLELGHKSAGYYDAHVKAAYWDGKDNIGQFVSSGFYFYTLETSDFTATKKMVIVK
ncbi:T9SS type A sorting domain-containing protein [Candidatus Poribacteria bacterium]|nr:T9SS type A sorting domain-containing protein [Candidatus Poribacteria bacterium]